MSANMQFVKRAWSASEEGLWVPEGPGKWCRPLRFLSDGRGWVELMRMSPGARLGWHRHTGEVHAWNLRGQRKLHTGELVAAGDYVHEREGNVDSWEAVGDEPLIVLVVVMGTVEYLGSGGNVLTTIDTAQRVASYQQYCLEQGIAAEDLFEPEPGGESA